MSDDLRIQHPSSPAELRAAVRDFERVGEDAVGQSGQQREQSVLEMQNYLKGMTPQERKNFYDNYNQTVAEANSPSLVPLGPGGINPGRGLSMPTGSVEKDGSGNPTGIKFSDSALAAGWNSLVGNPANEIHVRP